MTRSVSAELSRIKTSVIRKNPSPCDRNCVDRCVGCHSTCQKYIDWKDMCREEQSRLTKKVLEHHTGRKDEMRRMMRISAKRKNTAGGTNVTLYDRRHTY